jgi:hypothetical protein
MAFDFARGGNERPSYADDFRTLPLLEGGMQMYTGADGKSLTGNNGYFVLFRAEGMRGHLRPFVGAQFDYSRGDTSIDGTATPFTLYGGSFMPGYNLFLFREGALQPFFGVAGALGWNFLHLTAAPDSVDAFTQGFAFGYEVSAGVDIRFKRSSASALRLRCGIWNYRAMIGGSSSFGLNGYRFAAGFIF